MIEVMLGVSIICLGAALWLLQRTVGNLTEAVDDLLTMFRDHQHEQARPSIGTNSAVGRLVERSGPMVIVPTTGSEGEGH